MIGKTSSGAVMLMFSGLAGVSFGGSYLALFYSSVPFSIFPLIAFILSGYCLYQRYIAETVLKGLGTMIVASFILGLTGYLMLALVEYTAIGSNIIPTLICLSLLFWVVIKYQKLKHEV